MKLIEEFKSFSKTPVFRVILHIGFWLLYLSAPIIQYNSFTEFSNAFLWLTFIINIVFVLFYYPFAYWIVPKFFKWEKLHLFLATTILLYVVFFYASKGIQAFSLSHFTFTDYDKNYLNQSAARKIYFLPFILQLVIVTSIPLTLKVLRRFYALQDEKDELEKLNTELELNFLKSQINPHFLFNTLNNIYSLSLQKSDLAPEMIIKLSDLMRYILYECNVEKIALEKEVAFMKDYVELEKLRYGNHVDIRFKVEGILEGKKTPPLLLIHFVENAFKHGVNAQFGKSYVAMELKTGKHSMQFSIENNKPVNGAKVENQSGGIGLENIKKRLQLIYPGKYDLHINSEAAMYRVDLTIEEL
jgi:sensor histidine kinase YesM